MSAKKIIGASIGNCVHVGGVAHFLNIAQDIGYETIYAGPAVSVDKILDIIGKTDADIVALGYRLTPENLVPILNELKEKSVLLKKQPVWIFGGTKPTSKIAFESNFFDKIFDGTEDLDDCIAYLRNAGNDKFEEVYENKLVPRLKSKQPYPLLRHHFGLPSYTQTLEGVKKIADSKVLDVISLGIDQNTQQYFFSPEKRNPEMDGAGGVPVKTPDEFCKLKDASQSGNYPLMRCYSGTDDVIKLAQMLHDTIDNAWCAVPLFWYNELDARGTRTLEQSMRDAHELILWHSERDIPVEINEPHHWGLRDAHDVISVAASYISAYHAKKLGVKNYISQYMFNIPNSMSFSMDLAKVLAQIELTESLEDENFTAYRQTRAGLPFMSSDLSVAKGQLAASTMLQMYVHPNIIHVVGYSEAEQAATPDIIIESTKIVRGVIRSSMHGNVDPTNQPEVVERKNELISEAKYLLDFIRQYYADQSDDPLFDPAVLADCVRRGILDAPHIAKNDTYKGILSTRIIGGKCVAYDPDTKRAITESERMQLLCKAKLIDSSKMDAVKL